MPQWTNGIFGCLGDCSICKQHSQCLLFCFVITGLLSFICPCIQFGRNAEAVGESCLMYALSQFVPLLNLYCRLSVRGKIREQKGIEGTFIKDLLYVWCCSTCSLAQEGQVNTVFEKMYIIVCV